MLQERHCGKVIQLVVFAFSGVDIRLLCMVSGRALPEQTHVRVSLAIIILILPEGFNPPWMVLVHSLATTGD